jgi:y4mF family transcriptional regulator
MKKKEFTPIAEFVRRRRKQIKITQIELADKAGVGLRFVRDLEQNKKTLRVDKVNDVLILFGCELAPTPINREKLVGHE